MTLESLYYNTYMDTMTNTLEATGHIICGAYRLMFCTGELGNWIELYNANTDESYSKEYTLAVEVLNTLNLLLTSETMREEFYK